LKRLIIVGLFTISITSVAFYMKRESYVDIPTANFDQGLCINVSSSYPIKDVDDVKLDPNFGIDFSYYGFGGALKWYNGLDFSLDLSYQILEDNGSSPGLAVGLGEIASDRYISPAGSDEVFNDENYRDRPPEIASAYIVGTKKISENFEITAGIGRGKFIGYGPRSQYMNIDAFSDENHENWAVGLFGGMKVVFPNNLSFIIEQDGRDANIGIECQNGLVKGTLALNKLELFTAREHSELSPRISLNLSYKVTDMKKTAEEKKEFPVAVELIDNKNREPVTGNTVIFSQKGDTVEVSANRTIHSFLLGPGVYVSHITSEGYFDKEIEMIVKGEIGKNLYTVELNKKVIPEKPIEAKDSVTVVDDFGDIKNTVEGISVKFSFKKFDLTPRAYGILDRVVELVREDKNIKLIVIGHTCSIGTYEYNQELSERRAENVKEYLIGRGISPDRISTEAYGETRPIADNDTEENRKKNRRVQFILYRNND
jgi:outer membrane protein OmpA-like peptidoglycan-associated protein